MRHGYGSEKHMEMSQHVNPCSTYLIEVSPVNFLPINELMDFIMEAAGNFLSVRLDYITQFFICFPYLKL